MAMEAMLERVELEPAAALFRSLGDASRLAILQGLATGEARVVDLTGRLGLAQSTVSKHLACLRDCGLVDVRAVGRASVWRLTQPSLLSLLAAAEPVLAATGSAVAVCPTYGRPMTTATTAATSVAAVAGAGASAAAPGTRAGS